MIFQKKMWEKFLHKVNGPCDGHAARRVAELAMEMIKSKKNEKFISPVSYDKLEINYSPVNEDIVLYD